MNNLHDINQKEFNYLYKLLLKSYGKQGWWPLSGKYSGKSFLSEDEKFEICIGAILTQNTSWNNVNKSLNILRQKNLLKLNKLRLIDIKKLALFIKSSGYNNQKSKKIKEFIKFLNLNKEINRENLLSVWGIGNETADSMLLYAYNKPYFVIDAYTKRIFSRLGFCDENISYLDLQKIFYESLPSDEKLFKEYHALIVNHAKIYCRKKPLCGGCPLKMRCDYYKDSL